MTKRGTSEGIHTTDWFGVLFVVSCSQRKTDALRSGSLTPSRDAYAGTGFKIARQLLESAKAKWCILSGYYGFLWPDTMIKNYDVKMDPDPKRPWGGEFDALKEKQYRRLMSARQIVVLGSTLYAETAQEMLCRPVESPLAGLPIGKSLQKLKSGIWLNSPNVKDHTRNEGSEE